MPSLTMRDGTDLFFPDWGRGDARPKNGMLKVYQGSRQSMCSSDPDTVSKEPPAFVAGGASFDEGDTLVSAGMAS